MNVKLDGKRALITGGSRGLGKAMATAFAGAGADILISARDPEVLAAAADEIGAETGRKIMFHSCDVSTSDGVDGLYAAAEEMLGGVDILCNNAGRSISGPFETLTDEIWLEDLDLKLFAAIRMSRLVLPGMCERRWGRILNTVSIGGKNPKPRVAPTDLSRAAGIALTKILAGEYASFNITVNALCTGKILSAQWERFHQRDYPEMPFEEFLRMRGAEIPIGRVGEAEEFANVALFLASPAASYVTGIAINIDGGLSPSV